MVKIGPPGPKANTLDVIEDFTYALTYVQTWRIIKFFLEDIEPIDVEDWKREEDLKPEDHRCEICAEDFTIDDHRSVRLPCNHLFGEPCIKIWLSPYKKWSTPYRPFREEVPLGANTCPKCRREFFPAQQTFDLLPKIAIRTMLWDALYAHFGIALSEREIHARSDILQYLSGYPTGELDEYYPLNLTDVAFKQKWILIAFNNLRGFCRTLKSYNLTPVQEHLRRSLEEFMEYEFINGLRSCYDERGELSSFKITQDSNVVTDSESGMQDEEVEVEEESEELAEGDTEEMRFFRALFR